MGLHPKPLVVGGLVVGLVVLMLASSSTRGDVPATSNSYDDGRSWPVAGYGRVSSGFGWRTSPITGHQEFHQGIDIPAPLGTAVLAPISGRIARVEVTKTSGLTIWMHGRGEAHRLAHLSAAHVVADEEVKAGQVIGAIGSTGTHSTGNHLHWAVYVNGEAVDPLLLS